MNWWAGFQRLFWVLAALWASFVLFLALSPGSTPDVGRFWVLALVPIGIGWAILEALHWALSGFHSKTKQLP